MSRTLLLLSFILLGCMAVCAIASDVSGEDDSMPYDMSAVEEMERIEQMTAATAHSSSQAEATVASTLSSTTMPTLNEPMSEEEQNFFNEKDVDAFLEQRASSQAQSAAAAAARAASEAKAQAEHMAAMSALHNSDMAAENAHARQHWNRAHTLKRKAKKAAPVVADHLDSFAHVAFSSEQQAAMEAFEVAYEKQAQEQHARSLLEHQAASQSAAAATTEAKAASSAAAATESESKADSEAEAVVVSETDITSEVDGAIEALAAAPLNEAVAAHAARFKQVENEAAKALRRVEFLAKLQKKFPTKAEAEAPKVEAKAEEPVAAVEESSSSSSTATPVAAKEEEDHSFVATASKTKVVSKVESKAESKTKSTAPWWSSLSGLEHNSAHYQRGVSNTRLRGDGDVATASNSYHLPLGKKISQAHLNRKKRAAVAASPVGSYPLVPVQRQGASLAFNPYSGAEFHPSIPVPTSAPKLPSWMPESTAPWAGAGYYGSGGGQGPHPGSEAYEPLPGVQGKEFGIRAREAWEEHNEKYKDAQPGEKWAPENLPQYPFFPSWSRESEVGGRPDIFPKPLFNLPHVNMQAQQAAQAAFIHSELHYPHMNQPLTAPYAAVLAAKQQAAVPVAGIRNTFRGTPGYPSVPLIPAAPVAQGYAPPAVAALATSTRTPRLLRHIVGYPRPTAPTSWAATIPNVFPKPLNSDSFDENVNYQSLGAPTPTLGIPYRPADITGRNIMINSGPDKGWNPMFGGAPQYIPVPVAAAAQNVVARN